MTQTGGGGGLKTLFLSNSLEFSKTCGGEGGGAEALPALPPPQALEM